MLTIYNCIYTIFTCCNLCNVLKCFLILFLPLATTKIYKGQKFNTGTVVGTAFLVR